eukprot:4185429-Pyramimonas_sp.AAC.1
MSYWKGPCPENHTTCTEPHAHARFVTPHGFDSCRAGTGQTGDRAAAHRVLSIRGIKCTQDS